jgi:WD40 repeat protein
MSGKMDARDRLRPGLLSLSVKEFIMTVETKTVTRRSDKMVLRVTPDGRFAVIFYQVQNYTEGQLRVYDLQSKYFTTTPIKRPEDVWERHTLTPIFNISPDGQYIALTYSMPPADGHDGMGVFVWDVKQREYLPAMDASNVEYKSYIAFGVDGQRGYDIIDIRFVNDDILVDTTASGEVFVYSVSQKRLLWFVSAAAHLADSVAFSHKMGLFAMSERTVDGIKGGAIGQFHTGGNQIIYQSYGYSDSDNKSVFASENLNIGRYFRLWNLYSGALIRDFDCDGEVKQLMFSRDDKLITGSIYKVTHLWDVNTGQNVDVLPSNTVPIGFTTDNKYLVAQFGHNKVGMWQIEKMEWHQLYELNGYISSAQLIDNNRVVALSQTLDEWLIHQLQLEV